MSACRASLVILESKTVRSFSRGPGPHTLTRSDVGVAVAVPVGLALALGSCLGCDLCRLDGTLSLTLRISDRLLQRIIERSQSTLLERAQYCLPA